MPASGEDREFVAYVLELMQPLGPVSAKRMFGGYGIFLDTLMFALVTDSTLYLKADKASENAFRENGLEAFSYLRQGKQCFLSYFRAPGEALEDAEEMKRWAGKAYAAALRAASGKRKR